MLIGLCGKPLSGKSEVARILVSEYNFEYIDTKDKLRQICSEITGLPYSTFQTTSGKNQVYKGITIREVMGEIGLTLERMFGVDYLLSEALKQYQGGNAVVDSIRQKQALYFTRGKLIEVSSSRSTDTKFSFDKYDKKHIEFKLDNSGDLASLSKNIKKMLEKLNK